MANSTLVEIAPDELVERRASTDVGKDQRVTAAEDVVILDPKRPVCMHLPFEAAAGVDRAERVDVGDVGERAESLLRLVFAVCRSSDGHSHVPASRVAIAPC
jgi:hypothetical protein